MVPMLINSACSMLRNGISSPLKGKSIKTSWYEICTNSHKAPISHLSTCQGSRHPTSGCFESCFINIQACSRVHGRFFASSMSSPNAFLRSSLTPRTTMSSTASSTVRPLRTLWINYADVISFGQDGSGVEVYSYTLEVAGSAA